MHGRQTRNAITGKQTLTSASYRANPSVTDIATLSIGGNDIGFYNILTACVLWVGGYWAGDCDTEVAKANEILASPDFSANIMSALKKILDKSGNDTFKIYMTGYVTFFNEITPLCESSSFRIYNPHYDTTHEEKGQPWLTTALRTQLNDVVVALNMMLSHITNSVNNDYANTQRVVFVDPNPAYTGHRWCEEGVYEPDNERLDTWLFLSSAPDNNLPDNPLSASESYNQQQSEQVAGPSFALPDPTTCRENLAQFHSNVGTDWYGMFPNVTAFYLAYYSCSPLTLFRKYAVRYCHRCFKGLVLRTPSHTRRNHANKTG